MNTGLSGMNSNQFALRPVSICSDFRNLHGSNLLQLVVTRDRVPKARKQRFLTTVDNEVWNGIDLPEASAAQQGCNVNASETLTDSQLDLYDRMSEISEDCYCAQWIRDNEYVIWDALQGRDSMLGRGCMNPRLLRRCMLLSDEVGGWIYWADDRTDPTLPREAFGARFAPMAQWLAMVNERRNLAEAPKA